MQTSSTSQNSEAARKQLQGFDDFVSDTMHDWKVPGLAIAIVKDGEMIFSRGFGKRNMAQNLDMTPQTLLPIGSCTKAFTTTAMGMLVDEGKLDWDTPVRNYLPTFKMQDTFATERMTPRDLVTHRSGLPRHDLVWYNSPRSRKELVDSLQYLEPSKDFRTFWQYQNLMYMTAGYLVGEIAGQSWEEFVQQRILNPLGMTASTLTVADARRGSNYSMPYREVKDEVQETDFYDVWQAVAPAGSIVSSVEEMCAWLLLQMNKGKYGEKQLISEAQLAQIHMPQMIVSEPKKYLELSQVSYAMGWSVASYRGHTLIQHSGGINGFSALTTFLPDDNVGIVVLTNLGSCPAHSVVTYNACDRLLALEPAAWNERTKKEFTEMKAIVEKMKTESMAGRVPDTHPSHALDAYTGKFEHPGYGTLSIGLNDDRLQLSYNTTEFPLAHYHYDIFDATIEAFDMHTKVAFSSNMKGDIDSLAVVLEPAVKEIVFKRAPNEDMMEKGFLEQFVGEYGIATITMTVTLKQDKTLFLSVPGQPEYELVPYKGTEFQFKGMAGFSVKFIKDDAGNVIEASLDQPQGTITAKRK